MFNKRFLINALLIFCIIYDFSFLSSPGITSGRIAFVFICIKSIFDYKSTSLNRDLVYFLCFLAFLFLVSLIQYLNSLDFTQSSRILWFSIYAILTPFLFRKFFLNLEEFLYSILLATSLQAIISINSFLNPIFKQGILNILVVGGNNIEDGIYRAISFSGSSGAALSVIQFCGVFSGLMLLKYCRQTAVRSTIVLVGIFCCLLSTLIVGRTGLICSLLSIFYFLFSTINFRNVAEFSILILLISQINFSSVLESQTERVEGFNVDFFFNWIEDGLTLKNNNTVEYIKKMPIPSLSLKTILGTGEVFDSDNMKNASGHDSGYIQTYYSLGYILGFAFYLSYFLFLLKETKGRNLFSFFFIIILMFIIELKEPFIFKYILPFFTLNLILLSNKRKKI